MTLRAGFNNATDSLFSAFADIAFPIVISQVDGSTFDPATGIATPNNQSVGVNAFVQRDTNRGTETLRDEFTFIVNNNELPMLFGSGDTITFNGATFTIISAGDNSFTTTFIAVMVGAA